MIIAPRLKASTASSNLTSLLEKFFNRPRASQDSLELFYSVSILYSHLHFERERERNGFHSIGQSTASATGCSKVSYNVHTYFPSPTQLRLSFRLVSSALDERTPSLLRVCATITRNREYARGFLPQHPYLTREDSPNFCSSGGLITRLRRYYTRPPRLYSSRVTQQPDSTRQTSMRNIKKRDLHIPEANQKAYIVLIEL